VITAVALGAAGYGIAVAHAWSACHDWRVHAYPATDPSCHTSAQSDRPMVMAGSGAIFLLLSVGAVYLWTEDSPTSASRRTRR